MFNRNWLTAALTVILVLAIASCSGGGGSSFVDDGSPATMLARINADRTASGLPTLTVNTTIQTVAQAQATYMASIHQLKDSNAAGVSILNQVENAGVSEAAAELVGTSETEAASFNRLVNDPATRAVFNGVNQTQIGIGYATGDSAQYWCIVSAEIP